MKTTAATLLCDSVFNAQEVSCKECGSECYSPNDLCPPCSNKDWSNLWEFYKTNYPEEFKLNLHDNDLWDRVTEDYNQTHG